MWDLFKSFFHPKSVNEAGPADGAAAAAAANLIAQLNYGNELDLNDWRPIL